MVINYLKQALKIRKPILKIKFFKIYKDQLKTLKQQNIILDYKVLDNKKLIILINLNAKIL